MREQIRLDEIVNSIMYQLSEVIQEQERMNEVKAILYMNLHSLELYREETALSVNMDNTVEWVRQYLTHMALKNCTEATIQAYAQEYKTFFRTVNKPIVEITTADIRGYLAYCKLVRKNKDATINNRTRMLRGLFLWLTEEEYISKNPMLRIKDAKVEQRVKDVFSDEQVVIIKDMAIKESIRDRAIIDFLHRTGVRISEMVALDRDDIDFVDRQCIVYGKGRKERPVYMNGEAVVHLEEYLRSRTDDNPALFVSQRKPHRRLTDDGVRVMLKRIGQMDPRIGEVQINPHKFRRQFVTELVSQDVPIHLVADLAGHRSVDTTKNNYANYTVDLARQAYRKYVR